MRAQKCTERGFRGRAEAQEFPSRYRLTRTPAQCLPPPFHSATDWPELNQTKIEPILPFRGSAATLTGRFHLSSLGKTNTVPRNRVPIFHLSISLWIAASAQQAGRAQLCPSPLAGAGQQDNLPGHDSAARVSLRLPRAVSALAHPAGEDE